MPEISEKDLLLQKIYLAQKYVKGYKFTCSGLPHGCRECANESLQFITMNIDQAVEHSIKNNVTFWISKD